MTKTVPARLFLVCALLGHVACRPSESAEAPAASLGVEELAVQRAVLDYVEGFYEADSTKFARSIWPQVYKYGYSRNDPDSPYEGMHLPFSDFMPVAESIRADGVAEDAPKDVVIFDVQDQTASAKLTAYWGTDFLLLAKQNGRWMVTHVLWQGPLPDR